MPHVTLLGDSVFDNKAYTGGKPDVAGHLRRVLPADWEVTLGAIDGSTTTDVGRQFDRVTPHATHLVLSVGGNDALLNADLLGRPVRSVAEALDLFKDRLDDFEASYGYALDALVALGRRSVVCTIYNGDLDPGEAPRARMALMLFNDVILRAALERSVDVLDLRHVCRDAEDFANAIEPSGTGGLKIAAAIAAAIGATGSPSRRNTISAG